jgi:hypothetical protein
MPPHPQALFSLVPFRENERAELAVSHPNNRHRVSTLPEGVEALEVGLHICSKSSTTTLATLGRGPDADIYLDGSSIARIQCSFEIDLVTRVVMLYDRSHGCTTQFSGEDAKPFQHGRQVRKVLVQHNLNTIIGMGGERQDLFQFKLIWHQNPTETADTIKDYDALAYGRMENPRLTRTVDETPTDLPSRRQLEMRHVTVEPELGAGQFGTVYKAIDVDSGKFMAVKILKQSSQKSKQEDNTFKREAEILSKITHVSKTFNHLYT